MRGASRCGLWFAAGILLLSLVGQNAWAQPAQIILLRHAEKPDEKENSHLSLQGRERAMALAPFLAGTPELTKSGPPNALFAAKPTARDHSRRAFETLTPASEQWKITLQTPFGAQDYEALAKLLLQDAELRGKNVVVCWPHEFLANIAAALGVKPRPSDWKGSVYDRVWLISFPHGKATLTDLPQRLLFGDSKR